MAKYRYGFCWIASSAIVACLAAQSTGLTAPWDASQLARPFPKPASEKELIEQIRTASPEVKAAACKQLAIHGSKAAVPELAKLLSDRELASWARVALEAIPDPSADAALLIAAESLKGELAVGTINSIGVRRYPEAVTLLSKRLKNDDAEVASAAAVALGNIGNEKATKTLRDSLSSAPPAVRSAIAEGCILCAERLIADGKSNQAAEIFDQVRKAQVPKQRAREATRGAILARGERGIPLLIEQLKSSDKQRVALGLTVARELRGGQVAEALTRELASASPDRASLIVLALGDRDEALPPAVLRSAANGNKQLRLAAISVVGRKGDTSAIQTLLEAATDSDEELSQAGKAALAELPGKAVNADLTRRLAKSNGKSRKVLIELAGQRRMNAVPELVAALKSSDAATRDAALAALGATAGFDDLKVLIDQVTVAKNENDGKNAEKALLTACIRMPDREATAAKLTDAMPNGSKAVKSGVLRILGEMGGPKALATIAAAIDTNDEELQNVGTDVLGKWMTADAAPVLLKFAKDDSKDKKFRDRAFKGFLRIARQLKQLPDEERLAIARQALTIAERPDQRILVLEVLQRCPSSESIKMASALVDDKDVRDKAVQTAIFIGEKIKDKDPAAAKSAGEKALQTSPPKELADRARKLTSP